MSGALALAAVTVGALHALAPDHWVPLAAVARARRWSQAQTARVTILCGLGHVTVSVGLGFAALLVGAGVIEVVGRRLESAAGLLLVAFGAIYALWGLRRGAAHVHGHAHASYDHVHDPGRATTGALVLIYALDPCVAVIPLMVAAAATGAAAVVAIALVYELATIASMLALVLAARLGARSLHAGRLARHPHATAGAVIAAAGLAMIFVGA